jgi:hypothetical protein
MLTASNQILRLSPQPGQWQSTVLVENAAAYRKLQPRPIALDHRDNVYARFGWTARYSPPLGEDTPWQRQNLLCQQCFLAGGPDGNVYGLSWSIYQDVKNDLRVFSVP